MDALLSAFFWGVLRSFNYRRSMLKLFCFISRYTRLWLTGISFLRHNVAHIRLYPQKGTMTLQLFDRLQQRTVSAFCGWWWFLMQLYLSLFYSTVKPPITLRNRVFLYSNFCFFYSLPQFQKVVQCGQEKCHVICNTGTGKSRSLCKYLRHCASEVLL